ncbi:MAG: hypothetical protein JWM44_3059 [Bacilli bacterium]|nr:hypothetical protein [Bacilli bacterium]
MRKGLMLLLTVIIIILCCMVPIHTVTIEENNQLTLLDHQFLLQNNFLQDEKKTNPNFPHAIPDFIFVCLICAFIQIQIQRYIFSFVPLLKHYYLLLPIKYQSRYLVQSRFI